MRYFLYVAIVALLGLSAAFTFWACGDDDDDTDRGVPTDDDGGDDDSFFPVDDDNAGDDDNDTAGGDDDFADNCPDVSGFDIGLCGLASSLTAPWDADEQAWTIDIQVTYEGYVIDDYYLAVACDEMQLRDPQVDLSSYINADGGVFNETALIRYDAEFDDPSNSTLNCKVYVTDLVWYPISNKLDTNVAFAPRN